MAESQWTPNNSIRKEKIRSAVWASFKEQAIHEKEFQDAINHIGLFHFMHVVDVVADAIVDEQNALDPLHMRLDLAEAEIAFLRSQLDAARELVGRDAAEPVEAATVGDR